MISLFYLPSEAINYNVVINSTQNTTSNNNLLQRDKNILRNKKKNMYNEFPSNNRAYTFSSRVSLIMPLFFSMRKLVCRTQNVIQTL